MKKIWACPRVGGVGISAAIPHAKYVKHSLTPAPSPNTI
jgi:hypothetical protein